MTKVPVTRPDEDGTLDVRDHPSAEVGWAHIRDDAGNELPSSWKRTAPWRQAVQRRRTMVEDDLGRLDLPEDESAERDHLVGVLLADANKASQAKVGLRKWWWGTEVERAWARLREVEERSVDLVPEDELAALAADASAHASFYLQGDDKRVLHLDGLRLAMAKKEAVAAPALRAAIVNVLRGAHARADSLNQEARALRNRLVLSSGISITFAAMLLLAQVFAEADFIAPVGSGWAGRRWTFLALVMLFGGVGALFTAIPAMSKVPSDFSPFNLPLQQAVLKIAFGPLAAVVGLAALNAEAFQVKPPDTLSGILLIAIVFGAGQQAVTGFVDRRAKDVLKAAAPARPGA